jgi:hypothetical protein
MQILAPDILADARGLSSALHVTGLIVGLALWVLGWRNYRFWVVLVITVSAGTYGLAESDILHTAPLVAALLLAVAAGVLALSMIRLIAFAAGGLFGLVAVQALAPTWDQPLVVFLMGGLLGHLLFRLWIMALTSLCGTLLMSYTGLCLLDRLGKLDAVAWTEKRTLVLNWLCGAVAALGFVVQILLERRLGGKAESKKGKSNGHKNNDKGDRREKSSEKPSWSWGQTMFRKAG